MIGTSDLDAALAYLADRDRRRGAVAVLQHQYVTPQAALRAEGERLGALGLHQRAEYLNTVADWLDQSGFRPVEVRRGGYAVRDQW